MKSNQPNLPELLAEIESESQGHHNQPEWSIIYQDIKKNPSNYLVTRVRVRKEKKLLGKFDIPRTGRVIAFVDNDWLDMQTPKFKSTYSELKSKKHSAVVERVKNVRYHDSNVELTIERYLIRHR